MTENHMLRVACALALMLGGCGAADRDAANSSDEEVFPGTLAVVNQIPQSLRARAEKLSEPKGEITVDEIGSFRIEDDEPFCVLRDGAWLYSDLFFRGTVPSQKASDTNSRYNLLTKSECDSKGLSKFIAINVVVDWDSKKYTMELFAWSEESGEVRDAWLGVISRSGPRDDIVGILGIEGPGADDKGKLAESMNMDQLDLMNRFTSHVKAQGEVDV